MIKPGKVYQFHPKPAEMRDVFRYLLDRHFPELRGVPVHLHCDMSDLGFRITATVKGETVVMNG